MNHAGEIRTLVGIAEPDVRVWTNVGDAHIGHFGSREAVADAKAEILEGATPDDVVVANADDPLVMAHVAALAGRVITFGDAPRRDRARDGRRRSRLRRARRPTSTTPAGALRLTVALPGRAQLMNVLAAVAVAIEFGVAPRAIETRVGGMRGRSRGAAR